MTAARAVMCGRPLDAGVAWKQCRSGSKFPTESPQLRIWRGVPHRNPTDKTVLFGT
jgi:hypothetical protein